MEVRETSPAMGLSFHSVGPGDWTQAIRLESEHPYPLRHLTSSGNLTTNWMWTGKLLKGNVWRLWKGVVVLWTDLLFSLYWETDSIPAVSALAVRDEVSMEIKGRARCPRSKPHDLWHFTATAAQSQVRLGGLFKPYASTNSRKPMSFLPLYSFSFLIYMFILFFSQFHTSM